MIAAEMRIVGDGGAYCYTTNKVLGNTAVTCIGAYYIPNVRTDVDGVYTADPRIVEAPKKLVWCSFDEMLEMASLGARVLHSRSVEIARRYAVPILVASSFKEAPGTYICSKERITTPCNYQVVKNKDVGLPELLFTAQELYLQMSQQVI